MGSGSGLAAFLAFLAFLAAVGGVAAWWLEGLEGALNYEAGFFSALLVVGASAFGYWQMTAGAADEAAHHALPDATERIDDPYGLWEEEEEGTQDVKEVLRQEKERLKRNRKGLKGWLKNAKPALSLYRLGAYGLLAAGILWLIRDERFEPVAYLLGAGAAPLGVAAYLYARRAVTP
ncbi:hypothetical protein [Hydrogenimonas sp.]